MTALSMQCDIVSAEKEIFSGRIAMLVVKGTLGDLGILPGHAPLLTDIEPGPVRLVFEDDEEDIYFANGGFLEVQPGVVTILADTVIHAQDIDEAAAEEAQVQARRSMADVAADLDYSRATAMLADAAGRQRTLEELRKRRR